MSILSGMTFILLGFYLIIMGYVYLNQDWIIFARKYQTPTWTVENVDGAEPFKVSVSDTLTLDGLYIQGIDAKDKPIVLIFSGNSQDVFVIASTVHQYLPSHDVVGVNYRGYGFSDGLPSERAILADALRIYDAVAATHPGREIVVYGQSLGTSVAAYVGAHRDVAGVMLLTPFDSMEALGQAKYPWLPVKYLVKHRFYSTEFVKNIEAPVSVLVAENDIVVPKAHSDRLLAAFKKAPSVMTVPGGHSVHLQEGYKHFLDRSIALFGLKPAE